MAVSLVKGQNVSLAKEAPGLKNVLVGLGWDPRKTDGTMFDLDASVFLLGADGKVRGEGDFVFYNSKIGAEGAVEHSGDNRTGDGDGDDETIKVKLEGLAADIEKLSFVVTIDQAEARGQAFGQVDKAYIRLVDADNGTEIARYDLSEDASVETAMIFAELYRRDGEWRFKAIGQGYAGGLAKVATDYGVNIG
ncbi:TerD family protein [Thalassospira xianhensis]|uniref:Chemical-damaging agent resistance protein C n=1 Tax=Thalassospira xianhensis MCCC 1A02616 TaxID=1177929 RepID=A0A367UJ89_9PROT|nr:TerD family protein [Thalassospira xianhensis]RCK07713.1 chemical-damaging agent resistance protein C [Thalassospira xianhensis MCCC 1A02616]